MKKPTAKELELIKKRAYDELHHDDTLIAIMDKRSAEYQRKLDRLGF